MTEKPPPKKKRRKELDETYITYSPDISICLTADDAGKLGLQSTTFLAVDRLEYVVWNAVPMYQLTLLKSLVSESADNSDDWQVVEGDEEIEKGNYLLQFEESARPNVNLYRVKRPIGSCGTPTISRPSTPAGAINVTRTTLDTTTVPTFISKKNPYNQSKAQDLQCRRSVVLRDKYCLLTHTAENNCINSYSIPRHLLRKMDITTSGVTFETEYDPAVSILLEPNLDWSYERFHATIIKEAGKFVWQIFRNNTAHECHHYNSTTWEMAAIKASAHVDNSDHLLHVALQWHARHTIVRNWCTRELKAKLGFEFSDLEDGIADVFYDSPECLSPESSGFF